MSMSTSIFRCSASPTNAGSGTNLGGRLFRQEDRGRDDARRDRLDEGRQDQSDLKEAAANAVEQLLVNQDAKNPRVRVAIVPYAEAVNTGQLADAVFVEKRNGSNLPPPIDQAVSASATSGPDKCATERKDKDGAADFSDDGPYAERTYVDSKKKERVYLAGSTATTGSRSARRPN